MSPDSATVPDGAVIITATQQYAELREIGRKIDHLAAVMDPSLAEVRQDIADNRADILTLYSKVNALDKRVYAASVVAAFLGGAAGLVLPYLAA